VVQGLYLGYYTRFILRDSNMLKGSIVALVTPMFDDGSIDFSSINTLIEYHIDNGTDGIVAMGTTGESVTLSFEEHLQVIRYIVELCNKRILVYAGCGTNSTLVSVNRTKVLDEMAIDGVLCVVPYYNKPNQKGLEAHFKAIANATTKPVILYNVPSRTVADLQPQTVMALSKVDNIVGIKEATGQISRLLQIKQLCGEDFICLSGDDESGFEFLRQGGDGMISVTANVAAKAMAQLCHCVSGSDFEQAKRIDDKLMSVHQSLFVESNPVPTKWALQQMGLITSANVRLPLLSLEPIHQNTVKEAMKIAGLI
jgi:4-hydroxy-tetrahydrodipicolinate synthase